MAFVNILKIRLKKAELELQSVQNSGPQPDYELAYLDIVAAAEERVTDAALLLAAYLQEHGPTD